MAKNIKENLVRLSAMIRPDQRKFIKDYVKNNPPIGDGELVRAIFDFYITNKKK